MLENILIECVKALLEEEEVDIGFFPREGIYIDSYRKERLGRSHFYIARARAEGKERTFYISESKMKEAVEKARDESIEEILNGSDDQGK